MADAICLNGLSISGALRLIFSWWLRVGLRFYVSLNMKWRRSLNQRGFIKEFSFREYKGLACARYLLREGRPPFYLRDTDIIIHHHILTCHVPQFSSCVCFRNRIDFNLIYSSRIRPYSKLAYCTRKKKESSIH